MKKFFIVITLLLVYLLSYAAIEVPLYITDVDGVTDTLVLGLDPNATHGVDAEFGEVAVPDSNLLVELTGDHFALAVIDRKENARWGDAYVWGHKVVLDGQHDASDAFRIGIEENRFPVHVSWNPDDVAEVLPESFITNWYPGGWFDAVYGFEILKPMATESEISFDFYGEAGEFEYIESIDMRLGLFYVALTDHDFSVAIPSVPSSVSSFKSIVNGHLCIQVDGKTYNAQGILVK